jgi:hypothetical protein
MSRRLLSVLGLGAIGLASACGGRTGLLETESVEGVASGDAEARVSLSDSSLPATPDSSVSELPDSDGASDSPMGILDDAASAPPCTSLGGAGTGGNGQCTSTFGEACDGTVYQVSCACPQGSCECLGASAHVIHFVGCPHCPDETPLGPTTIARVFALCGFPTYETSQ